VKTAPRKWATDSLFVGNLIFFIENRRTGFLSRKGGQSPFSHPFSQRTAGLLNSPAALPWNHMDDQQFRDRADEALGALYKRLSAAGEQHDFEADFNSGALAIEFDEPPGKFVISPNSPVHQIWVSAHSRSFKLEWNDAKNTFVMPDSGQTLNELIADAIGKQLGEQVSL